MGSFITFKYRTMRVTEQIDALEVMGVNSLNYLFFPKLLPLYYNRFNWYSSMFLVSTLWMDCRRLRYHLI
jgi:phospholipid/cholesterol/gamma-HCH transport system permease protein